MNPELLPWIVAPLVGALIGWATNALAVRMIFRPHEPRRVLGFRVHGLIGRRQEELAESIGSVVGDHLLRHEDIVGALAGMDLAGLVDGALKGALDTKLDELRRMPLIGGFLTDERVADLRGSLAQGIAESDKLAGIVEQAVEQGLDVRTLVREKVAAFPVARLEELVLAVARQELRRIEVLGGGIGALVGLAQAALLTVL